MFTFKVDFDFSVPLSFAERKQDGEDIPLQGPSTGPSTRSLRSSGRGKSSGVSKTAGSGRSPVSPDFFDDILPHGLVSASPPPPSPTTAAPPVPGPSSSDAIHSLISDTSVLLSAVRNVIAEEQLKLQGALQSQIDLSIGQALQQFAVGSADAPSSSTDAVSLSQQAREVVNKEMDRAQKEFNKKAEEFQDRFFTNFEARMSNILDKVEARTNEVFDTRFERFQERVMAWMQDMALPSSSEVNPSPADANGESGE